MDVAEILNAVAWFMQDLFPPRRRAAAVLRWGDDGRETEDSLSAILDYPQQLNFSMSLCNTDTHFIIYGSNGKLDVWAGTLRRRQETARIKSRKSASRSRKSTQ